MCCNSETPLYRLEEAFKGLDSELILGVPISPDQLNDNNLGRAMDKLFEAGTNKIFSQISQNAIGCFKLDTGNHHFKSLHKIKTEVVEAPKYDRGRPQKGKERQPKHIEYEVNVTIEEDPAKVEKLRLEAGCFVLITNVPAQDHEKAWTGEKLLRLYKEQDGIEKNFGFLKDPAIVNAIFLKKTERVEALGLILLLSLLLWRLVERDLNLYVKNTGNLLPGWDKRMTKSPTAFMMTTKFLNVLVITAGKQRHWLSR
ncbi:DUF4277 domain-containing protein [uncultured Desulfobacter sp.]|uniref:DUF4277 domain-containing protein n=1 Tax=uncultured Desulfobacter sp. TaxID=240139 RepID=UPI0029F4D424|nr:DUF4277 domain-containing protein [uncultured Desulfobacter sp.]